MCYCYCSASAHLLFGISWAPIISHGQDKSYSHLRCFVQDVIQSHKCLFIVFTCNSNSLIILMAIEAFFYYSVKFISIPRPGKAKRARKKFGSVGPAGTDMYQSCSLSRALPKVHKLQREMTFSGFAEWKVIVMRAVLGEQVRPLIVQCTMPCKLSDKE